ncbi:hypothetical protein RXV86_16075 [Alisedimentitalea sp. MJ-SS2]|uniref:hypothetical protein n=1 Tax=Aliisedimentitalea sp. MJ-SS2 TaxID=3049795 RepID=UPI0029113C63|nr:hypothetical protein [Alisedimentitalea sp. MJ-SS2]MDU8928911.1 hypothetical protein [Alisedimentitalea sp. MJ-SS2]
MDWSIGALREPAWEIAGQIGAMSPIILVWLVVMALIQARTLTLRQCRDARILAEGWRA